MTASRPAHPAEVAALVAEGAGLARPRRCGGAIRAAALAVALLALAPLSAPAQDGGEVVALVGERLRLMKDVAAWKHAHGVAVEDGAREAVVLDAAAETAAAGGLDRETALAFFRAQIEAAKAVQACWIERWEEGEAEAPADPPDLKAEIRPRLIEIADRLVAALAAALAADRIPVSGGPGAFAEAVRTDCLEPAALWKVRTALANVRRAE